VTRAPTALVLAAAAVALLLGGAASSRAQGEPGDGAAGEGDAPRRVVLEARLGLIDGQAVRTGWVPLEVYVESGPGPTRTVELVVRVEQRGPHLEVRRRLELGPDQRRREWFVLPVVSGGKLRVDLEGPPAEGADPDEPTLLATSGERSYVADDATAYRRGWGSSYEPRVLHVVEPGPGGDMRHATWLPRLWLQTGVRPAAELPDRAFAYDGVDLVVLQDVDLDALSGPQQEALEAWVAAGGRVLLVPSRTSTWLEGGLARRLLGGREVRAAEAADLRSLEATYGQLPRRADEPVPVFLVGVPPRAAELPARRLLSRSGNAWPLAERLPGGRALPLSWEVDHGAGRVLVPAVDVSGAPFDRWPGLPALVQDVLDYAGVYGAYTWRPRTRGRESPFAGEHLRQALDSRNEPSRVFVVFVVLIYVGVVGPLNWFLLRRRDAQVWLVATIPATAVAFSLFVFAAGYAMGGLSTVVWRSSVVSGELDAGHAWERTAFSVLSAVSSTYEVEIDGDLTATRVYRRDVDLGREALSFERTAAATRYPDLPLALWEQAYFEGQTPRNLGEGVALTGPPDALRVRNGSPHALAGGVVLAAKQRYYRVPPLDPGETSSALGRLPAETIDDHRGRVDLHRLAEALAPDDRERALLLGRTLLDEVGSPALGGRRYLIAELAEPPSRVAVDGEDEADLAVHLLLLVGEDDGA